LDEPPTPVLPRKGGGSQTQAPFPLFWSPPSLRGRVRVGGSVHHLRLLDDPRSGPAHPAGSELPRSARMTYKKGVESQPRLPTPFFVFPCPQDPPDLGKKEAVPCVKD